MKTKVAKVNRGQIIRASWLTKVAKLTTRHDSAVNANTSGSVHTASIAGTRGFPTQRLLMVRMLRDLIPAFNSVGSQQLSHASQELELRSGENAEVLSWDAGDNDFRPNNGKTVYVYAAYSLPVAAGTRLLVRFDYEVSAYVPTSQPETEMVRVTNNVPNANGLLEGVIQRWNDQTLLWEDALDPLTGLAIFCWVVDANA